ncbi:DUF2948 family protein [Meridianimarinicoccus sp. MJW13]|uniref:DUF2948 family protein n=1 Tax=Meridianimarinicoccus sp. MJW13 TaxID=2720031 RepID=UPI0018664A20|nr:DUF2948 family protein [Fluviibacterium sp. MJW13]
MSDARFEDGAEQPLRLLAETADDLAILSALVQDAVFPGSEMTYRPGKREFALLLNRFRWEDRETAKRQKRPFERVQSVLLVGDVLKVASQGIDRDDTDTVLSLLSVTFDPAQDGAGEILLTLAGDGAIRLTVECLNLHLRDVTKPYVAPSGKAPDHEL